MLSKVALFGLVIGAVWIMLARALGRAPARGRPPLRRITSLVRCPDCGVYRVPGGACGCPLPPDSRK